MSPFFRDTEFLLASRLKTPYSGFEQSQPREPAHAHITGCALFFSLLCETVPNTGAVFYFGVPQEVES
jgi:hypothetical protein